MAEVILQGRQGVFVAEYVDNELAGGKLTAYEVAIKAGYHAKNAHVTASQLMSAPKIIAAIAERKRLLAERAAGTVDVDAIRVLREWTEIAIGDPTEIVKVRRLCCRHCWGFGFSYQYTDAEYAKETAAAMQAGEDLDRFSGGNGFRLTRDPHPECPECGGEGVESVHVVDFRRLTDRQRRLIAGVKTTRDGMEVKFRNQDEALKNLAQYLGLLVNKNEHTGPGGGPMQHANVNYTLPADPIEAAKAYQRLMEGK